MWDILHTGKCRAAKKKLMRCRSVVLGKEWGLDFRLGMQDAIDKTYSKNKRNLKCESEVERALGYISFQTTLRSQEYFLYQTHHPSPHTLLDGGGKKNKKGIHGKPSQNRSLNDFQLWLILRIHASTLACGEEAFRGRKYCRVMFSRNPDIIEKKQISIEGVARKRERALEEELSWSLNIVYLLPRIIETLHLHEWEF